MRGPQAPAWLRLVAVFAAIFVLGTGLHYLARPYLWSAANRTLNAVAAAHFINSISRSDGAERSRALLVSHHASIRFARGCGGIDVPVAFPMAGVLALVLSSRLPVR